MATHADDSSISSRRVFLVSALAFVAALVVYVLTAYPTITWWDSGNYSCAAIVLGITPPPGSLLLVILGWLALQLPSGLEAAYTLNILAAAIGALTVGFMTALAVRVWPSPNSAVTNAPPRITGGFAIGALIGVLAYAFAVSVWRHAVKFNPYILSTLFTVLILWVLVRWWDEAGEADDWSWFVLIGVLLGLDFSVHRTNLLLVPGIVVWVAIRRLRSVFTLRAWAGGVLGFIVGLSFHLLHLPIAAHDPFINMGDPSSLSRLYDYVSLKQYGGSFLMNVWERNSALFSSQVLDVVRTLSDNLFWTAGKLRILGLLSGALAIVGWMALLRRRTRMAIALTLVWILTGVGTVGYFNIPEGFFRPFDRHYLPLMVPLGILMGIGSGAILNSVWKLRRSFSRHLAALVFLLLAPAGQLFRNWTGLDGSEQYFAYDFAHNALSGLPENAILFANGDNDTWPTLYVQLADSYRTDVHLLNLSLFNTSWYLKQRPQVDPDYPVPYTDSIIATLQTRQWNDTTVIIPPPSGVAVNNADDGSLPRWGIRFHCPPILADKYARTQDIALLDLLKKNRWQRPVCFYATVYSQNRLWVDDHIRQDGLHYTVVPATEPEPIDSILAHNVIGMYEYRGYNDHSIPLNDVSRHMGRNYYPLFLQLCQQRQERGDLDSCRAAKQFMLEQLPLERLDPPEPLRDAALRMCTEHTAPGDTAN